MALRFDERVALVTAPAVDWGVRMRNGLQRAAHESSLTTAYMTVCPPLPKR